MPTTSLFVISDLHLADGRNELEGFLPEHQTAFESFLQATLPGGSFQVSTPPLLIVNGDCFDFLAVPPYPADGLTTPALGLKKLAQIAAAHEPFFCALRAFLDQGGRVTFLIGNHDIELCFAEVRARVAELLDPDQARGERLHFCLDQYYRPVPDVYIEHGNQYDFWNATRTLWDQNGKALASHPARVELPPGTQYMQRASLPLVLRYPFFDHFEPPLGVTRQVAFLCLLDPPLIAQVAQGLAGMISSTYQPLNDLPPGAEQVPAALFACAMSDFALFQQATLARVPDWSALAETLYSPGERTAQQETTISTFFTLQAALTQNQDAALQAIFAPLTDFGDEDTTRGMHHVLRAHPEVHVALAGHTHVPYASRLPDLGQCYLNTASWTQRLAPPGAADLTPAILNWLRVPDLASPPLTNKTSFVFAHVSTAPCQPSSARLYAWEGGKEGLGHYRELTPEKEE